MSEHLTSDQLAALVSGQLSGPAARAVASHLDICAQCAAEAAISRRLFDLDESGLLPELAPEARTAAVATIRRLSSPKRPVEPNRGTAGGGAAFGLFGLFGGAAGLGAAFKAGETSPLAPPLLAASAEGVHPHPAPAEPQDVGAAGHHDTGPVTTGGHANQKSDAHPVRTDAAHASEEQEETFPGLAELEAMFAEALGGDAGPEGGGSDVGHPTVEELHHPWDDVHLPSGEVIEPGFDAHGDHANWFHGPEPHDDPPHDGPHDPPVHDDDPSDGL